VAKENRFDYANHLLMVDNFLPIFEMDAQRRRLPKKNVEENLTVILDDIKIRKNKQMTAWLGTRIMSAVIAAGTVSGNYAKKFTTNSSCNKCGICTKVCPAKNIAVTDDVGFGGFCERCLACTHLCPQNAIHLKGQRSEKRWRNPEVSLNEIISSNNRGVDKHGVE